MTRRATLNDMPKRQPTKKAIWECAVWLEFCVSIGWEKSTLDRLQEIWWEFHDDEGRLI